MSSAGGPLHLRLACRDLGWVWPIAAACAFLVLAACGGIVQPAWGLFRAGDLTALMSMWWALPGLVGWAASVLIAIPVGVRANRSRVDVSIDPARREIDTDHATAVIPEGGSVEVIGHAVLPRSRVVVRDAAGRDLWQLSHLHPTQARALALDLSETLGLAASPALTRIPTGTWGAGQTSTVRSGVHGVKMQVWSRAMGPEQLVVAWTAWVPLAVALMTLGWSGAAVVTVPLTAAVVLFLGGSLPVRRDLELDADTLIVRTRGLWVTEERVAVAELLQPRIVADRTRAALMLRSTTGFLTEIRGRPARELEQVAWWIEHARREAVPGLPDHDEFSAPAELERLLERVREPER